MSAPNDPRLEQPPEAQPAPPDENPPPRRRRWLRRLLIIGGALSAALLATVAVLLFTETGTRFAIEKGVATYAGLIPGEIEAGRIEGTLGRRLVLGEVLLQDAAGRTLLTIDEMEFGWRPAALLRGRAEVEALAIRGVEVFLPGPDQAGFADLAPPSDGTPPPPEPQGSGFDLVTFELPLAIGATIEVTDAVVHQGPTVLLTGADLRIDITGEGRNARVTLAPSSRLALPGVPLTIGKATFGFVREGPSVHLDDMAVETDVGAVRAPRMTIDLRTFAVSARLQVDGLAAALRTRFGVPLTEDPWIKLSAGGSLDDVDVQLDAELDQQTRVLADVRGRARPPFDLGVTLRAEADALERYVPAAPGHLAVIARAHLTGTTADPEIVADLTCAGCTLEGVGPVQLDGAAAMLGGQIVAKVVLAAADVAVDAEAMVVDGQLDADLTVAAPRLDRTAAALKPIVAAMPPLAGALRLDATCRGPTSAIGCTLDAALDDIVHPAAKLGSARLAALAELGPDGPRFAVDLAADDLVAGGQRFARVTAQSSGGLDRLWADLDIVRRGRDRVTARAELKLRPTIEASLLALDGRSRGVGLQLAEPARVAVGADGVIRIDGLDLSLGRGRITTQGHFDPAGDSDLAFAIDRFDLKSIEAFVPGIGLRGRVQLDGALTGRLDDPAARLKGRIAGVRVRGLDLGTARVEADVADGRLDADLRLDGGVLRKARVEVGLDLPGREQGRPARVRLTVDRFRPARLASLVPALAAVKGTVDLDARLGGTRTVGGTVGVKARGLAFDRYPIGDLDFTTRLAGGQITVESTLDTPLTERVALSAAAPMRIDLGGGLRWRRSGDHRVALSVGGLDVARAAGLAGELPVKGAVDLDLVVSGPATAPTVDLTARGTQLGWKDFGGQGLDLAARLADEALTASVTIDSPLVESLGLTARVPLRLRPFSRTPVDWRQRADHQLAVELKGLSIAGLESLHGQAGLDGRVGLTATVSGPATAPVAEAELTVADSRFRTAPAGDVRLTAQLGVDALNARVRWDAPGDGQVDVSATVPVKVAPLDGGVDWSPTAHHVAKLEIVGLDRVALAPFVALPDGLEPTLDWTVDATGGLDDFHVRGPIGGRLALPTGQRMTLGGRLDATPDRQQFKLASKGDVPLTIALDAQAPINALRAGTADVKAIAVSGEIDLPALPLAPLAAIVPPSIYDPAGDFTVQLAVDGTVGAPDIEGVVRLTGGAVTVVDLNQRLSGIELALSVADRALTIETLSARSGTGRINGHGEVALRQGVVQGDFVLGLRDFPLVRPGVPRIQLGGRIVTDIAGPLDDLEVEIGIRRFVARLIGTNVPAPQPPAENARIVYLDAPPVDEAPPDPNRRLRLTVALRDPARIVGAGAEMAWGGTIHVDQQGGVTRVEGALESEEGRFILLGREFLLERGRVFLPQGGGAPYLDIQAGADINGWRATVEVKGKPTRPELKLSSEPALPPAQVFTLVLTGLPESAGEEGDGGSREIAALLTAFSSPQLEAAMHEKFGVDRVGIGFGATVDEPILSVGKRLSRTVYVETVYHHNAPEDENTTEARVNYRFAPGWSLDSAYGDAGKGSIELAWSHRFGGVAPPDLDALGRAARGEDEAETNDPER